MCVYFFIITHLFSPTFVGLRSLHPFAPSNLFRDGEEDDDDGIRMTKESKNID